MFEIHHATDSHEEAATVVATLATVADCVTFLEGRVKALEGLSGLHAEIEPTEPHPQVFVYALTGGGWARVGRYTIHDTPDDNTPEEE